MNKLIGTIAGIAAMISTIVAIETVAHSLYPAPGGTSGDMARIVATMPTPAKLLVMLGWFTGPLVGTAIAARLTPWRPAPWIVAGLAVASGLATVAMIPHPLWMSVGAVALPIAALWLGERLGRQTRTTP